MLYLQAALETFLVKGYEGTSIEEIARAARASRMTLYRLYGSKEELFRRVVDLAIGRARASMRIKLEEFASTRAALHALIRQLHDAFTDATWLGVQRLVIAECRRFPALARELLSHDREVVAPVEEFLKEANGRGSLVIGDAHAAAFQLAALASGGVRFLIREPGWRPPSIPMRFAGSLSSRSAYLNGVQLSERDLSSRPVRNRQ